ncbi:hypothetical protein [Psychrobacter namhaensis]|uniref:hypothetical protein n=2 Tax=Psychrobacter namhaensis TaxID=292734 RepID=UPI001D12AA4E|nr:hypothetical protein [Psychrobacter namhaensis]
MDENLNMKSHTNPLASKSVYPPLLAALLSLFLLTACQESPKSETANKTHAEPKVKTTPITTNINVPESNSDGENTTDNSAQSVPDAERDIDLTQLEDNLEANEPTSSNTSAAPNPEQAIKGAQITDVRYKSAAGESLSVVFETSAAGLLNAIVTLPNKPKITLSAPEGQGNNPTYRSSDESIQLISHAGGGTIDFIQNNNVTSFDAVSAKAEVITE